jgi:hypothetical protein
MLPEELVGAVDSMLLTRSNEAAAHTAGRRWWWNITLLVLQETEVVSDDGWRAT